MKSENKKKIIFIIDGNETVINNTVINIGLIANNPYPYHSRKLQTIVYQGKTVSDYAEFDSDTFYYELYFKYGDDCYHKVGYDLYNNKEDSYHVINLKDYNGKPVLYSSGNLKEPKLSSSYGNKEIALCSEITVNQDENIVYDGYWNNESYVKISPTSNELEKYSYLSIEEINQTEFTESDKKRILEIKESINNSTLNF